MSMGVSVSITTTIKVLCKHRWMAVVSKVTVLARTVR